MPYFENIGQLYNRLTARGQGLSNYSLDLELSTSSYKIALWVAIVGIR